MVTPGSFLRLPVYALAALFVVTVLSGCILFLLAWQTTGRYMPSRRGLLLGAAFGIGVFASRLWMPVPVLVLAEVALLAAILRLGGKTRIITAVVSALFVETVLLSGSVLLVGVIFMLTGARTQSFFSYHTAGIAIGSLLEVAAPALTLLIWGINLSRAKAGSSICSRRKPRCPPANGPSTTKASGR